MHAVTVVSGPDHMTDPPPAPLWPSPRADAAARVLLELAQVPPPGVRTAEALASSQRMTPRVLNRLLVDLSRAGLVVGLRGPSGGYRLAWPPDLVTFADIVAAVDQPLATACGLRRARAATTDDDRLAAMWAEVQARLREVLEGLSLGAVLRSINEPDMSPRTDPANER